MANKRTILITGCSDGSLGSQLALTFHKIGGWRVFASARNMSKLKRVEAAGIETIQLDVTSEQSIATAVLQVKELTGGALDVLLNNAGTGYSMPLMDLHLGRTRDLFELNIYSIVNMTRAFLPLLLQSRYGRMVVNNTSIASLVAGQLPFQGAYNASKAAATSLTETLRLELQPFGIKVINLMTGGVVSTFWQNTLQATLPPTSMYNVAKEAVEKFMSGKENEENGADIVKWANQVVKQLGKRKPPYWVWAGAFASAVRLSSFLPTGLVDGITKSFVGLDIVEKKIKEQGGLGKLKLF